MRRKRVIIFDYQPPAKNSVKHFFEERGYEALTFREPAVCPVYARSKKCPGSSACCDILLVDAQTLKMNAIDLLVAQKNHGCPLTPSNKAIISESLGEKELSALGEMGSAFFRTPIDLAELEKWVEVCETRIDLSRPVAVRRREERKDCFMRILFVSPSGRQRSKATAINLSYCGICIKTSQRLLPNQQISIKTRSQGLFEEAVVRWAHPAGDGTYIAGLSFCI